jgi:hypothetical protein
MNPTSTPTAPPVTQSQDNLPGERATRELPLTQRQAILQRRVLRSLATSSSLTGMPVLDYGLHYVAVALHRSARWALLFASAGVLSFCAVLGAPDLHHLMQPDSSDVRMEALGSGRVGAATRVPGGPIATRVAFSCSEQESAG